MLTVNEEYHHHVVVLVQTDDIEDPEIDDILDEISDKVKINIAALIRDDITGDNEQFLEEKINPTQYPYFLVIQVPNKKLDQILSAYRKKHWIRSFFQTISVEELYDSATHITHDLKRTVYHTDNIEELVHFLIENGAEEAEEE